MTLDDVENTQKKEFVIDSKCEQFDLFESEN